MPRIEADTIIDNRYRVISRIGSGGMADVFCAEDLQLGRKVAIKLLHERFSSDVQFVERFKREASNAAGLQHPNVVQVYDRGEWDGTYYIAMEYLDGRSLKELIREEGPISSERSIDIVLQILRAAKFAHRRGVVHRDIKPHNAIIDSEDRVKVTDFGIARVGASDMTETGSIMGTANYISPEQAQGDPALDQSDLYSVGVVLYELLTAKVPFSADSVVTVALKHLSEPPLSPRALNPDVSPGLEAIVLRALAKNPQDRFADADDFMGALQAVRGNGNLSAITAYIPTDQTPPSGSPAYISPNRPVPPPSGRPPGKDPKSDDEDKRWLWAIWVAAALVIAGALVGVYLLISPGEVDVPNVVGKSSLQATNTLKRDGFLVNTQLKESTNIPDDQVISQSPTADDTAMKGSTVTIVVSTGPGLATIPTVSGLTQKEGTAKIQKAGFEVEVRKESSDSVKRGRVIGTEPPERVQILRGQTVTLVVSKGPTTVSVPDLVGLTETEARATLTSLGFVSVIKQQDSTSPPKTVLSQSPEAESEARKGSKVTVTVAKTPASVSVPDVTGETESDASAELTGAGFQVKTTIVSVTDPDQDGVVVSQNPSGNSQVKGGSIITLNIGSSSGSP